MKPGSRYEAFTQATELMEANVLKHVPNSRGYDDNAKLSQADRFRHIKELADWLLAEPEEEVHPESTGKMMYENLSREDKAAVFEFVLGKASSAMMDKRDEKLKQYGGSLPSGKSRDMSPWEDGYIIGIEFAAQELRLMRVSVT